MKSLIEFLNCDVSLASIEHRPRVRRPQGAKRVVSTLVAPDDDEWLLYRAPDGHAYYVQKVANWWHKFPWKKTECVELTPVEAVAFLADIWGGRMVRQDALRHVAPSWEKLMAPVRKAAAKARAARKKPCPNPVLEERKRRRH